MHRIAINRFRFPRIHKPIDYRTVGQQRVVILLRCDTKRLTWTRKLSIQLYLAHITRTRKLCYRKDNRAMRAI